MIGVSLQLEATSPRVIQYSLLQPPVPAPENLARTLGRLWALVGEENAGSPILPDSHRPDAFRVQPFQCKSQGDAASSWESPPPLSPVSNEVDWEQQLQLSLRRFRRPRPLRIRPGQIRTESGPWRSSGDWWQVSPQRIGWSREEWDLELRDGTLARVFWDPNQLSWFLEGFYD